MKWTSSARVFCFPNVGHVMLPLKTVSFKFCQIHVDMNLTKDKGQKTKDKFP